MIGTWPIIIIQKELVDPSIPWAYFDGSSQNNNTQSRGGAFLCQSSTHFFHLYMGFEPGTNNNAELLALKVLLLFAKDKEVKSI
jgi:ribonuclease HI